MNNFELQTAPVYAIAWQQNTFTTKYYINSEPNGSTISEHADEFEIEEEAKELINANNWINCYVTTKD